MLPARGKIKHKNNVNKPWNKFHCRWISCCSALGIPRYAALKNYYRLTNLQIACVSGEGEGEKPER